MYYCTQECGPNTETLRRAFKKLGEIVERNHSTSAAMIVPQKGNLEGVIREVLGDQATRQLEKHNKLELDGLTIHLFTERKPINFSFAGPALVIYATNKHLDQVVKCSRPTDLIFVPWADTEQTAFISKYQPTMF